MAFSLSLRLFTIMLFRWRHMRAPPPYYYAFRFTLRAHDTAFSFRHTFHAAYDATSEAATLSCRHDITPSPPLFYILLYAADAPLIYCCHYYTSFTLHITP